MLIQNYLCHVKGSITVELAGTPSTPISVQIDETVTGDVNGDGDIDSAEIVTPAILMREGDASDIELKDTL